MIQAANKFYVIKALGQTKETSGGIIIQNSDETELAEILSAGPEIEEKNLIPVGSKVAINWGSVVQIKVSGTTYFILHADHVLGVVKDD